MIELPGSKAGNDNSPKPLLGPDANNLISFTIFLNETAIVFKVPWNSTKASWQAKASNLLGAVLNFHPVSWEIYVAIYSAKPTNVFNPVPTAVPPYAKKLTDSNLLNILWMLFLIYCS